MSEVFFLVCIHQRQGTLKPSCAARGGLELLQALQGQGFDVKVETARCLGRCETGPTLRIGPGGPFFAGVTAADVPMLLEEARRFAASLEQSHPEQGAE